jgi:hypothetical protein
VLPASGSNVQCSFRPVSILIPVNGTQAFELPNGIWEFLREDGRSVPWQFSRSALHAFPAQQESTCADRLTGAAIRVIYGHR